MNETLAKVMGQVRQAFTKVKDAWKALAPARRRMVLIVVGGLIALAVGLTVILNAVGGRYTVLYEDLSMNDSLQGLVVLQNASIPARRSAGGQLMVPANKVDAAMVQLAMNDIPSTTLGYDIFAQASGLTTTEFEKQEYNRLQWQDRLQDSIATLTGVRSAIVHLYLGQESNKVWDPNAKQPSGSVQITMEAGYVLSSKQVKGIRNMVGMSVGIDPENVTIIDQNGNMLADEGESYDEQENVVKQFVEVLDMEAEAARRLEEGTERLLAVIYPDPNDYAVTAKVEVDTDKLVKEIKEYFPLEGTTHGVEDERETKATMGVNQLAEGVVGETDNTDVPIYVDINGDGNPEYVDYYQYIDFAVSYTLEQIERQNADVASASISVLLKGTMSDENRLAMRESVRAATNLPLENVVVNAFPAGTAVGPGGQEGDEGEITLFIYVAAAAAAALVLILILVLLLRSRKKKRLEAEAAAAAEEEAEEAERVQREIEERKKQLKTAAIGDESENAILNDVREFAKANPEIAANLLRNWLKDGVD